MDRQTTGAAVVAAGAIWQELELIFPYSIEVTNKPSSKKKVTNKPYYPFRAGKFTDDQEIHEIVAQQVPLPIIDVVHHTWEPYMGQPMVQKVPDTCVLVACTVCLEAVHRLQNEKLHGKATTAFFPYRAAAPSDLLEACRIDGVWKPGVGAYVGDVLNKILEIGGVPATNAAALVECFLPLHSWREHSWDDEAGGLSPERVARLLHNDGPCIGLLWVSPWYHRYDAGRDDALVYTSGCGRSDDDARRKIEELHPGQVGWHAVVCFGYRFRGGQMHVLVLDNHTPTGPRRWIEAEEFHTLYTLSV